MSIPIDWQLRVMTLADHDEVLALWRATEGIGLSVSDEREAIGAYLARNRGRALVEAVLSELKAAGMLKCNLFLYAHNEAGRAFWLKHGWAAREDLVVVQKPLA